MSPISRGFTGRRRPIADPSRIPPGQYVTDDFPVLSAGPTPRTRLDEWTFTVDGAIDQPVSWRWEELMALESETITRDIHCVTKWSKLDTSWRGVPVDALVGRLATEARYATAWSDGGYTTNLGLADITGGRAWIAYEFGGRPLDPEHGGPARLLVPHLYCAARQLVAERGVAGTSLDDVRSRAGVSKSQLYHYFADRDDLMRAVTRAVSDEVVGGQAGLFAQLDTIGGLRAWADALVTHQQACHARGGCPIGSLAGQLAEHDDDARRELADGLDRWEAGIRDGLERMKARGELLPDADPGVLAQRTLAAVQGGLLLTQIRRDPGQLRCALSGALDARADRNSARRPRPQRSRT